MRTWNKMPKNLVIVFSVASRFFSVPDLDPHWSGYPESGSFRTDQRDPDLNTDGMNLAKFTFFTQILIVNFYVFVPTVR